MQTRILRSLFIKRPPPCLGRPGQLPLQSHCPRRAGRGPPLGFCLRDPLPPLLYSPPPRTSLPGPSELAEVSCPRFSCWFLYLLATIDAYPAHLLHPRARLEPSRLATLARLALNDGRLRPRHRTGRDQRGGTIRENHTPKRTRACLSPRGDDFARDVALRQGRPAQGSQEAVQSRCVRPLNLPCWRRMARCV